MVRVFETGATRDSESGKLDYEGFLNPVVLARYAEYMHYHRVLADGTLRDSDDWQKGMPLDVYMKSALRHMMEWWTLHREGEPVNRAVLDALCGVLFNTMGYMHEMERVTSGQPE